MNKRQIAAIKKVEEAMKELKEAGLALAGIDYELLCFSRRAYDKASKKQGHVARLGPSEVINEFEYYIIECPYIDSGGT